MYAAAPPTTKDTSGCLFANFLESFQAVLTSFCIPMCNHADRIPAAAIAPIAPPSAAFLFAIVL